METDFKTNYLFSKYKDKSLCNKMTKYNLIEDASRLDLNYTVVYKMVVNYQISKYGYQLNSTGYEYNRTKQDCINISHKINKQRKYRVDAYTQRYLSEKNKEIC